MLDPDAGSEPSRSPDGHPPSGLLSLLAVHAVESAAWTATLALSGLLAGPVLALARSLTHAQWLAWAAPLTAKVALGLSVLAAALVIVALALTNLDLEDEPEE